MVISHRQRFRIAEYHRQIYPEDATDELAQGLVFRADIAFESWLGSRRLQVEGFLDPGADNSLVSERWLHEQAEIAETEVLCPRAEPSGRILEPAHLSLGGHRLALGNPERPLWIARQGRMVEGTPYMPGYEDLLLGRDFITQHGLLIIIDGEQGSFSVLAPSDAENRRHRDLILRALDRKDL